MCLCSCETNLVHDAFLSIWIWRLVPGEFGVVYKAEYTQATEEDGYEIHTVAVKTLKGS